MFKLVGGKFVINGAYFVYLYVTSTKESKSSENMRYTKIAVTFEPKMQF